MNQRVGRSLADDIIARKIGAGIPFAEEQPADVYFLADSRTPRHPRYIGISTWPPARLSQHRSLRTGSDAMRTWKRDLRANGATVVMVVISHHESQDDAREAEWRLMQRWRRRGLCDLNNERDGELNAFCREWRGRHPLPQ